MPDQNPIYDFMKSNKLTDLDEKTFVSKYSAPDKAKEIHSFFVENNLTDLDETKFYDKYLKKKVGSEESSLTELPLQGFSKEQIDLLQKGVEPPKPTGKAGTGLVIPTNIARDQIAYERELKRNDAAINTLKNTYKQKGLNFNENSKRGQEQISELLDKERNNDLVIVPGKDNKQYLVRGEGFLESGGKSLIRSITEPIESSKINFTNNPSDLADLLDEKISQEPNVPEGAPTKFGGYLGELAGGLPKMAALLSIPVAGESALVGEMYHNALANQRMVLYQKGLQQGMDRVVAAKKAMENAPITAIPDAVVGAVMARGVAGRAASEIIPNAAKESFLKATGNGLKGVAKVSALGGLSEYGRSKTQQQQGYNVTDAEAIENGLRGAGDWAIMDAAFKLVHAGPKYLSSAAKNVLSSIPKEIVEVAAEKYPDGKQTISEISKFTETKNKVQDFVPEEKLASITGLTEKADNLKADVIDLEQKKKAVTPAVASQIDTQIFDKNKEIKFYDNQIKKVIESKDPTGITEEIDDVTGYKAGEAPIIEEYDLKMGDIITANIGGKEEKGRVTNVGTNKGQIVIDFIDENNNERFVYGNQIKNIEKGQSLIDNLSKAQKERKAELLNKEELTSEELSELDELNKSETEVKQISNISQFPETLKAKKPIPTEEVKPAEVINKAESFFNDADIIFPNDDIRGGYAVTNEAGKQIGRVKMSEIDENTVKIDEVVSEKRGERTGNGSTIMKMVIDNADKNNVKLVLTPNLIGEMKAKGFETPEKLQKFYEKFGFVKDKGKATMTREPKIIEIQEVKPTEQKVEKNQDDLKKAEAKFLVAEDKLKKARNKIENTQVKQAGMFGGEQKGMFAMGGEEAKSALNPLRKAVKEAKVELDNIKNRIKVQERVQPELTPVEEETPYQKALKEKQEAEKKQTRQVAVEKAAASRMIFNRVFKMDAPEDAKQIALRYLADGGKLSKEAIDEAYGSVKRAQLNVKRRELLSEEVKSKDFAGGNETLDKVAHRLWEENGQRISERDIKESLMAEIGNNNTRLEAAEAYLDKYSPEYQLEKEEMRLAEQYKEQYLEEQAALEEELRKPIDEQIEGEASEDHINNLIEQYEAEIKGEDKQLRSDGKGEVSAEISEGKVAEKAPKSETELVKEYKEATEKASKKAKENAKKEFVNRNFDSLVEKLKIQIKCPT